MKVYVDKIPNKCEDCVFSETGFVCDDEVRFCKLKPKCMNWIALYNEKRDDCTLCSLAEHDKQVRKEVVEFIDKCFEMQKYESIWINSDKTEFGCDVGYAYEWWESFRKILLDQIRGEPNET